MVSTSINTINQKSPTIYAYSTPEVANNDGWVKIGYTDRDVEKRVNEQTHTAGIKVDILWHHDARFDGGQYFTDHEFHDFLRQNDIQRKQGTEWFYFGDDAKAKSEQLYVKFMLKDYDTVQRSNGETSYILRSEQSEAVTNTLEYMQSGKTPQEFLWNAKPRFGKTLSTYDFMLKGDFTNILIVTNRPAIANSWYDDFTKFIKWQAPEYLFVSGTDALKNTGALSRTQFEEEVFEDEAALVPKAYRQVTFVSLQKLKQSQYFRNSGGADTLKWIAQTNWDLLVVDEAHEGIDTTKTDKAFDRINTKFTLHLTGTPFKQLANGKFSSDQIYNWSYADEQAAKANWDYNAGSNPYEKLPQLNLFTYQLSSMITDELREGTQVDGDSIDYAFDLNEFFATDDKGYFVHKSDVEKWLDRLVRNKKYPFSTPDLRNELKHTFWLLNRVASAKALAKLLHDDPVFSQYKVIIAAGDGNGYEDEAGDFERNAKSFDIVRKAIAENDKTITLSVGQLTTGVTIPEWTAVMMLSNMKIPALYMQAAFRAQNPYGYEKNGNVWQKENAYIFDFAPERTLNIFDEFANNLQSHGDSYDDAERRKNIKTLLNFFPVIGEDDEGTMVALDTEKVLTIPKTLLAREVVKRGFMSNLLFANVSGIFALPKEILNDVLGELPTEKQGKKVETNEELDYSDVNVDENGDAIVPESIVNETAEKLFGDKVYDTKPVAEVVAAAVADLPVEASLSDKNTKKIVDVATNIVTKAVVNDDFKSTFGLTAAASKKVEKTVQEHVAKAVDDISEDHYQKQFAIDQHAEEESKRVEREAIAAAEQAKNAAEAEEARHAAEVKQREIAAEKQAALDKARSEQKARLSKVVDDIIESEQKAQVEVQAKKQAKKTKDTAMEDARGHLRGFARTIPSFLMAYGERETRLENFDDYTPDDVFKEVTGISEEQFRLLRDGGEIKDSDTGEMKHFNGHLFNEPVFNESIQEFLTLREELADYTVESKEDIFDYIPAQETNQIFTPKNVVKMMVDKLEAEDPHVFENPDKTFIDLFMKSGLYITELVKRLYNNPVMIEKIPDGDERRKHILEKQLYGLAPSDIIQNIATNYIFSFDTDHEIDRSHFKAVDTRPAVKDGKLAELLAATFTE